MADKITINGKTYNKSYFDIFEYVKTEWQPDWETIEDLTINDLWDSMKEHSNDEDSNKKEIPEHIKKHFELQDEVIKENFGMVVNRKCKTHGYTAVVLTNGASDKFVCIECEIQKKLLENK